MQNRSLIPWFVAVLGVGVSVSVVADAAERTSAETATRNKSSKGEKSELPDLAFLEYLGSLESDEDNWTDVPTESAAPVSGANSAVKRKNEVAPQPEASKP